MGQLRPLRLLFPALVILCPVADAAAQSTEILRPNGIGNSSANTPYGCTNNWECVDEVTADGNTTYVYTTSDFYLTDTYALQNSSGSGTITSVTIYISSRASSTFGFVPKARTALRTYSTDDFGSEIDLTTSWANYSTTYTTNPITGSAWTWSEVDALEIGVSHLGFEFYGNQARTTQVWVEVDYTVGGAPSISSAANQTFTVGDPATSAETITIIDDAASPTITAANDIRIRIPSGFNMVWDNSVTAVTLGGNAASKVSATLLPYEDADATAVLDVTSDFAASDTLTIDGPTFTNFTAASAADNLELEVNNDGAVSATDDKTITIVAPATLLGRYWLREAPSGQAPASVQDDQASPVNLAINYTPQLAWTVRSGNRGLQSADTGHAGRAYASAAGTKYATQLDAATQASFAAVASWVDGSYTGRLAGFEGGIANLPVAQILTNQTGGLFGIRFRTKSGANPSVGWSGAWNDNVRRVFHFVYDAQNATANRRIRLYVNGVDQGAGVLILGSWPAQGEGLDFSQADLTLQLVNTEAGSAALKGTVHYYAVYDGMLADADISSDATALLADDDNLNLAVSVTPDGADTLSRLPSNGTNYSYKFTVTNNSSVDEDFDLFGFPGDLMATFLTVDSIVGPNVTRDAGVADSARISGLPASTSDSAFVWYSVAAVAAGSLDSLYLKGRSFTDGTTSDSGWVFVQVVKPNLTITKDVSPSGTQAPGTDLTYTLTFINDGGDDAVDVVIVDSLAAELQFKLNSVVNNLPSGLSATVEYSDDGGSTWTYTPADGACGAPSGYDACVTHIRWTFQSSLSSTPPDNTGDLQFVARIE